MAPTIEARIHELVRLIVERTEARVEQAFAEAIADELDARQKGPVLSVRDEPVSPIGDTLAVRASRRCGETKPLDGFPFDARTRDGRRTVCDTVCAWAP